MAALNFRVDDRTEELLQFITQSIDDTTLDGIEIHREVQKPDGLASEPITVAVTITLGTVAVSAVLRLVERWIEYQRQLITLKIVADGFSSSDEAGRVLANLAEKHASISVSYGIAKESWKK